jgi:hypothetical protein
MDLSVLAEQINALSSRPLEAAFIALTLVAIGAAFLISWLRDHRQDHDLASAEYDSGEWLLRTLTFVSIVVVAIFIWLTLHVHR